ncbi:hypothetical protein KNP414_02395 [Paenibacillus mucilaginosus KNP414]|uniref:Uncharacterized protein n=1 Tax=Paenibacillus mucilaginosus (strain KNP414) TaxID=1036673 RepID=F8F5E5_PAEMK|nr:hypothetical protein KNP414_02395 [Paenibacillus mucilaginosus KNP414]
MLKIASICPSYGRGGGAPSNDPAERYHDYAVIWFTML